jgi:hypothetical protein
MKRLAVAVLLIFALGSAGCGPLTSIACDNVAYLCGGNVDLAACDATMQLAPPYHRAEILECTSAARTCEEAVACFTTRGYSLLSAVPASFPP